MKLVSILRPATWVGVITLVLGLQAALAEPLVYVPLGGEGKIVVVDAATDDIVDTISIRSEAGSRDCRAPGGSGAYRVQDIKVKKAFERLEVRQFILAQYSITYLLGDFEPKCVEVLASLSGELEGRFSHGSDLSAASDIPF